MKFICVLFTSVLAFSFSASAFTIEDYNSKLLPWGVSWKAGERAVSGYYPSFYTGFAVRSEFPNRIHIRVSRGNQTRVSVILDEQTLMDYVYDLKKRYDFYKVVTQGSGKNAVVQFAPDSLPQLDYFNQIIESKDYGILDVASQSHNPQDIYKKSLEILKALNPGRVFDLNIDLAKEFHNWKVKVQNGEISQNSPAEVVVALNSLVWGRINYTKKPSSEVLSALSKTIELAKQADDTQFTQSALALFQLLTEDKYSFKTLSADGSWESAIQCEDSIDCKLVYTEFTTIYPTGSLKSLGPDGRGNRIPIFATPGLWNFIDGGGRDVDNIRSDPYYGWAPKMDYQIGTNGFHNPAVRFMKHTGLTSEVKESLGIDPSHTTYWAVRRGGVSHGCLRLPLGHVWELRHIMPVENEKFKQAYMFGNHSEDFDIYDIDGNGTLEVMGVDYMIAYDLQGDSNSARREGADLRISANDRLGFYTELYGSKGVFNSEIKNENGKEKLSFSFISPGVSFPSYIDVGDGKPGRKADVKVRVELQGNYPLYEQAYERDKVQFYTPNPSSGLSSGGPTSTSKRIVRLMGRVKGCAPSSDKVACGEQAFDQEAKELLK